MNHIPTEPREVKVSTMPVMLRLTASKQMRLTYDFGILLINAPCSRIASKIFENVMILSFMYFVYLDALA